MIAARTARPAAIRNDSRYPATSEPLCPAVPAAAAVARIASPTAAPICWLVVNSAPASPCSVAATPLVIAIDAVGSASPIPAAVSTRPGSTAAG